MPDIPCKDCITFAICRLQIKRPHSYEKIISYLYPKCSLVKEYTRPIWNSPEFNLSPNQMQRVIYFLEHGKEYDDPL